MLPSSVVCPKSRSVLLAQNSFGEMAYDLKHLPHLKAIISVIQSQSNVEPTIERFPFHQLQDVSETREDLVRPIVQILLGFYKECKYEGAPANNEHVSTFYTQIINSQLEHKCNNEILGHCIEGIYYAGRRSFSLQSFVSIKTLNAIITDSEKPEATRSYALRIFARHLENWHSLSWEANMGDYLINIWKAARKSIAKLRLRLACCYLKYLDNEVLPNFDIVFTDILDMVDFVHMIEPVYMPSLLNLFGEVYTKCTTPQILYDLSVAIAKLNFPRDIRDFFESKEAFEESFPIIQEILINLITNIFASTPWNDVESVRTIVMDRGDGIFYQRQHGEAAESIDYILFYLELYYADERISNDFDIVHQILKQFRTKLPSNPVILKCVYLLFAAYIDQEDPTGMVQSFQTELLLSLQHLDDMDRYMSYHEAHLAWVLRHGGKILQRRTIVYWLRTKAEKTFGLLIEQLPIYGAQKVLLDIAADNPDVEMKTLALELFSTVMPKSRSAITKLFYRPDLSVAAMNCIMKSNPVAIDLPEKDSPQYPSAFNKNVKLVKILINILEDESKQLNACTSSKIMSLLFNCCIPIRNSEKASCFVRATLVKMLIPAIGSSIIAEVVTAYRFLLLIAITQDKLNIRASETMALRPSPLRPSRLVNEAALSLYKYVMHSKNEEPMLSLKGQHLALYYHFMDVLTFKDLPGVCDIILELIGDHEECVASAINVGAIRMHCEKPTASGNFVRYLTAWCQAAERLGYVRMPTRVIASYVKHLVSTNCAHDFAVLRKMYLSGSECESCN